jgi:hypothetical protein
MSRLLPSHMTWCPCGYEFDDEAPMSSDTISVLGRKFAKAQPRSSRPENCCQHEFEVECSLYEPEPWRH